MCSSLFGRDFTGQLLPLPPTASMRSMDSALTQLCVARARLKSNTRPVGLRFALITLRLLEHWRSHLDLDTDSVLIVLATLAITMEKFTRGELEAELRDVNTTIPPGYLSRCNVSSIAAATGMNRETTRRKVGDLVEAAILVRDTRGWLRVSPEYTRAVPTDRLICSHLESLVHATNELLRLGAVEVRLHPERGCRS